MKTSEEKFLADHWRKRMDTLDPVVLKRLAAARAHALARVPSRAPFRFPGWSLPVSALAASGLLALAVWIANPPSEQMVRAADAAYFEDAEVMALSDDPGLYTEDPDFLEWSDAQLHSKGI